MEQYRKNGIVKYTRRSVLSAIFHEYGKSGPEESPAFEVFIAEHGWPEFTPEPSVGIPIEEHREHMQVTRRQGMLMLEAENLLDAVEAYFETAPRAEKIEWLAASVFKRLHPLVISVIAAVGGRTPVQLDEMFSQAPILYP